MSKTRPRDTQPAHCENEFERLFQKMTIAEIYATYGVDADTCKWIDAIQHIDHGGDTSRVLALLRSSTPITINARNFLADLLARHRLTKLPGNQRMPAYETSAHEHKIIAALHDIEVLKDGTDEQGKKRQLEDVVKVIGKKTGIRFSVLYAAYRGARKPTNETFKRLEWLLGDLKISRKKQPTRRKQVNKQR